MANGAGTALGLSIGATNLAAVAADQAITRKPVLTLYPERAPEVGIPAENPRLDQPGLVLTGFVNRVLDPRGIVAADGSVHRSEELIADAMRALAYAVTGGRALPESVAVTYPAHWASPAVDAVGSALSSVAEWSNRVRPLLLIPDAAATLLAVQANPGIPRRGTVAVCDFGGSGTNVTFMRADGDYQALAPTVRLNDFSGDSIDQALLSAVISNMPSTGSFDPSGTVAIGSLSRLRTACRSAKEELSSSAATTLTDGLTGEIRVTRNELDEAIRTPLDRFVAVLENALARNGIQDLVAVVSAGGGANIPAITTTLSQYFRVPVVTTPRPQLTAATGAALRAAHGPGETAATASALPAAPGTATAPGPGGAGGADRGRHARTGVVADRQPIAGHPRERRPTSGVREREAQAPPVSAARAGRNRRHGGSGPARRDRGHDRPELGEQIGDDARAGRDQQPGPHAARQHRDRPAAGTHRRGSRAVDHGYQPARQHRDAVYQRPVSQTAAGAAPRGRARTSGDPAGPRSTAHSAGTRSQRTHPGARPGQ